MTSKLTDIVDKCAPVDQVSIGIDYQIIRHFSKHLYGSPNKAVEELITNSFDAFATKVFVYVPGKFVNDKVVVWDNGAAMNKNGFHQLWWIANSPKDIGNRTIELKGKTRKIIGKFGIGKLASYAVGSRMTHLCKQQSEFLLVTVDYKMLLGEHDGGGASTKQRSLRNAHIEAI